MITELELHAYIDNELSDTEHNRITELALNSPAILAQLNELQHLKSLIWSAYSHIDSDTRADADASALH